jgi:hypothetical protein
MTPEPISSSLSLSGEGEDEADCVADELPHGGGRCTLLQLPTAAQAQPTVPSRHSRHARLHSVDSTHESTYTHSCGEQWSTSEPQASPNPFPT